LELVEKVDELAKAKSMIKNLFLAILLPYLFILKFFKGPKSIIFGPLFFNY